jgi:hypothetical protein
MSNQPQTLKNSMVRPLVKLDHENRDAYEQLLRDSPCIWAIREDHSFEEVLSHMIRVEMTDGREQRRRELITILEMMDLSDIPE